MEKYGFVYIWYDRKHKRYYVGCRWGNENDGYISSSVWMRNSYKRRPQDFKRRVISRIYTNRQDLLQEEYRWLQMIPNEQLGKNYYNLHNHHFGHWSTNDNKRKTIGQKISNAWTEEKREKARQLRLGQSILQETKDKISKANKGKMSPNKGRYGVNNPLFGKPRSLETKINISNGLKGKKRVAKKFGKDHHRFGKQFTEEQKQKLRKPKNRNKTTCPYCLKHGDQGIMTRFHFENCKEK